MEVTIRSRNVEVTPRVQEYIEKKIGRLDRYLPTITEADVELAAEKTKSAKHRQIVQLTVRSKGTILRVEERDHDVFTAIDTVLDKMYRRIGRYKGKRMDRTRAGAEEVSGEALPIEYSGEADSTDRVVRTKQFQMVPMNTEEAIEQMELLGHDFYVFYNAIEGKINVLYRRKDQGYGLLQPELV